MEAIIGGFLTFPDREGRKGRGKSDEKINVFMGGSFGYHDIISDWVSICSGAIQKVTSSGSARCYPGVDHADGRTAHTFDSGEAEESWNQTLRAAREIARAGVNIIVLGGGLKGRFLPDSR